MSPAVAIRSPRVIGKAVDRASRLPMLWPELAVVAAVLLAFHSTVAGTAHLPYDAEFFHYPLLRDVQQMLSSGRLPAWDPFSYGGSPLLANAQSAWLYPLHLLLDGVLWMLGKPLTQHTLDVVAVLHVALAGVATCAVARGRGLGSAAAAYAGIFVVLNGAVVSQVQHLGMVETFGWLPLAVLIIDRLSAGLTTGRIVALGAVFALIITAGFVPLIPACVVLIVGTALARTSGRREATLGAIAGIALGVALAGAMLLPILGVLGALQPLVPHGSLPTDGLQTSVLPNALGHWLDSAADYAGSGNFTTTYYYLGGGALILLPLALTSGRAALREALLVVVLLFASFGATGQWIANVFQGLPNFGALWRPEDVAYVVALPLALMLARGLARPPAFGQIAIAAAFVACVAAIPISVSHGQTSHLTAAPWQTLFALLLTGAAVAIAWLLHRQRRRGAAVGLVAAAVVAGADLAAAVPARYFVNAPGPATSAGPNATGDGSAVLTFLHRHLAPDERIAADAAHLPPTWNGFPPVWQLSDVNGFQPQFSKYQLARVQATGVLVNVLSRMFPITPGIHPYLDEMDARYVVVATGGNPFARARGYTSVFSDSLYDVYSVDGPLHHGYGVDESCLRRDRAFAVYECQTGPAVQSTQISPAAWRFRIDGRRGVPLLVTGEPWYPGWEAHSSTRSLSLRRVGYLAAVTVPPGTTEVTLKYSPPGLCAGILVSVLSLGASVAVVLLRRRVAHDTLFGRGHGSRVDRVPNAADTIGKG